MSTLLSHIYRTIFTFFRSMLILITIQGWLPTSNKQAKEFESTSKPCHAKKFKPKIPL